MPGLVFGRTAVMVNRKIAVLVARARARAWEKDVFVIL